MMRLIADKMRYLFSTQKHQSAYSKLKDESLKCSSAIHVYILVDYFLSYIFPSLIRMSWHGIFKNLCDNAF